MSSPPVPYSDFEFTFDPSLSSQFPGAPTMPSSADLFSQSETTDLLGFLDGFDWELGQVDHSMTLHSPMAQYNTPLSPFDMQPIASGSGSISATHATAVIAPTLAPSSSKHLALDSPPRDKRSGRAPRASTVLRTKSARQMANSQPKTRPTSVTPSSRVMASAANAVETSAAARANKVLLSTPQKRLNHIQSEQKRRNAIRDGYAQLIALLSPGLPMPSRGRPKGKGDGATKGKSGVLFRAVEYVKWLEEGRNALKEELARVEGLST